jgi:hypothetical protein
MRARTAVVAFFALFCVRKKACKSSGEEHEEEKE